MPTRDDELLLGHRAFVGLDDQRGQQVVAGVGRRSLTSAAK